MRYLLCFIIGLSGLLFLPANLAAQSTFNELTEVKALQFKDKKALKGYLMVPQFVSVDLRKGIVKPAKGIYQTNGERTQRDRCAHPGRPGQWRLHALLPLRLHARNAC